MAALVSSICPRKIQRKKSEVITKFVKEFEKHHTIMSLFYQEGVDEGELIRVEYTAV